MRHIIIVNILLALTGCAIYKNTPPLDSSLSNNGKMFIEKSTFQVSETNDEYKKYYLSRMNEYLENTQQNDFKYKITLKDIEQKYPLGGKGFQCFEPMLLVLSLGIIPSICEQETTYVIEKSDISTGSSNQKEFTFKTESVAGWVSLFYSPSSEWNYGDGDDGRRALYTIINDISNE